MKLSWGKFLFVVGLWQIAGWWASPAAAATWTVGAAGRDYTTIAAAVANANTKDGDTIAIADGIHTEQGITVSKSLTFVGQGAAATIVQAHAERLSATDRIFSISAGKEVAFRGLTLQHGYRSNAGGGAIYLTANVKLTMEDCLVRWND